jgi:molybdenum storage protein
LLASELMGRAKHMREIQIVNGLVPGSIAKAMRGEAVGTVVHAG